MEEPPLPTGFVISFDPNGGVINYESRETNQEGKLSSLPTPKKRGYSFKGWYTEPAGGSAVNSSTVFSENTVIYARWEENQDQENNSPNQGNEVGTNPLTPEWQGENPQGGGMIIDTIIPADPPKGAAGWLSTIPSVPIKLGEWEMLLFAPLGAKSWSVMNLIIVAFGVVFVVINIIRALLRRRREFDNMEEIMLYSDEITKDNQRMVVWLAVSFISVVAGAFLFLIFQDPNQSMVVADLWTVTHVVLLAAEIFSVVLAFKKSKKRISDIAEIENNALTI